jgi:hypothetical protein
MSLTRCPRPPVDTPTTDRGPPGPVGELRNNDREMPSFKGRLLEAVRPRALDFRPRLAHAIDTVQSLGDAGCVKVFAEIDCRVDTWMSRYSLPSDGVRQGVALPGRSHTRDMRCAESGKAITPFSATAPRGCGPAGQKPSG